MGAEVFVFGLDAKILSLVSKAFDLQEILRRGKEIREGVQARVSATSFTEFRNASRSVGSKVGTYMKMQM